MAPPKVDISNVSSALIVGFLMSRTLAPFIEQALCGEYLF